MDFQDYLSIFLTISYIVILCVVINRSLKEKYSELGWEKCDKCFQTGQKLAAGTVFVSYPEQSSGLGWVL